MQPSRWTLLSAAAAAAAAAAPARAAAALVVLLVLVLGGVPAHAGGGSGRGKRDEPPAGAVALASAPPQTVELALPFTGIWGVLQGTASNETHVGYAAYALDFVPAESTATALPEAQRKKLTDYPCFGRPVLAPADGRVVWARDRSPDPPLSKSIVKGGDTGNFLIIEHAPQEYTEFRHLQARSLRVKVGDRVTRGQEIARCGNSGNAGMPHLHVGFLGSVDPIATRPVTFSHYEVLRNGTWERGTGVPTSGQLVRTMVDRRVDRRDGGVPSPRPPSGEPALPPPPPSLGQTTPAPPPPAPVVSPSSPRNNPAAPAKPR